MAYKIFYIDDLETESRKKDLEDLGYDVKLYDPTSNLNDLFTEIEADTSAVILDYRLTKGAYNACFDAPTIAQTLRTKHKDDNKGIPLILMSNEKIKVSEFDKDFTSQDLFDFVLTKEDFTRGMTDFKHKLNSFIVAYEKIKTENSLIKLLGLEEDEIVLHSRFISTFDKAGNNQLKISADAGLKSTSDNKLNYEARKEQNRKIRKAEKEVEEIEKKYKDIFEDEIYLKIDEKGLENIRIIPNKDLSNKDFWEYFYK